MLLDDRYGVVNASSGQYRSTRHFFNNVPLSEGLKFEDGSF